MEYFALTQKPYNNQLPKSDLAAQCSKPFPIKNYFYSHFVNGSFIVLLLAAKRQKQKHLGFRIDIYSTFQVSLHWKAQPCMVAVFTSLSY